jgi:hypothetical protein
MSNTISSARMDALIDGHYRAEEAGTRSCSSPIRTENTKEATHA